jgi:glycine cleavage system aminomethyltransferase T
MENRLPATAGPIACGPLIERHRRAGAQVEMRAGWEIAVRYPHEPAATETRVIDLSHRPTFEINGPDTSSLVTALCVNDLPLRHMHIAADWEA